MSSTKTLKATLLLALLSGCYESEGTIVGKVVDVEWGGFPPASCEIIVQKGEGASKMDQSSSRDKSFCDKAQPLLGKTVQIKYRTSTGLVDCFGIQSCHEIISLEAVQ